MADKWDTSLANAPNLTRAQDADDFNMAEVEAATRDLIEDLLNTANDLGGEQTENKAKKFLDQTSNALAKIFERPQQEQQQQQQNNSHTTLEIFEDVERAKSVVQAIKSKIVTLEVPAQQLSGNHSGLEMNIEQQELSVESDETCNEEQNRALIEICTYQNDIERHRRNPRQFAKPEHKCFMISGGPGVGKSYFAQKLKERFMAASLEHVEMICAAPTGIAASCLPGI
jgi:transcriptional regulator with PAS, ATPase and Fis domain